MPEMGLREYSRHRSVTLASVQAAIKNGRIDVVRREVRGMREYSFVDSEAADRTWEQRTNSGKKYRLTRGERDGVVPQVSAGSHKTAHPATDNPPVVTTGDQPTAAADSTDDGVNQNSDGARYAAARAKNEENKAKLAELEWREKARIVVNTEAVKTAYYNATRVVMQSMLNVSPRISPIVAAESDARRCHDIIDHEIRVALQSLADGNAKI